MEANNAKYAQKNIFDKKNLLVCSQKKIAGNLGHPRPGGWVPVPVPVSLVGLSQCPQHTTYFKLYYL